MSETNLEINENELPLNKSIKLLIGSLLLGTLFNILFYEKTPGVSIPVFIVSFYIFFFLSLKGRLIVKADITSLLLLVIILISSTFALFYNPVLLFFNVLALPVLIAAHTILTANKNTHFWYSCNFVSDLIFEGIIGMLAYVLKPFSLLLSLTNSDVNHPKRKIGIKIMIGLAISVPLLYVLLGLLSSADAVFENALIDISKLFADMNLNSLICQLFIIILISLLVFSYVWNLAISKKVNSKKLDSENTRAFEIKFDFVIVTTVLSAICFIYLAFIGVQFTYLFASVNLKLPADLTYAEYARKGFFELVLVTLINLSILITNINFTKITSKTSGKVLQILNSFLVTSTLIILFSAHFRMSLYEKVYGYTYLRFFTHAFMFYIFALLLAVAIKIWYHRLVLAKYLIVISLLAFTIINFVNADKIIAERNTTAYHTTGKVDVTYFSELSYDGVPYMLELLTDIKSKYPDSKEARILENSLYFDKKQLQKPRHWQSYNRSAAKARKLLINFPLTYRNVPNDDNYSHISEY